MTTKLLQIVTSWDDLLRAQSPSLSEQARAQASVLQRYLEAVWHHLHQLSRDPHVADDLTQEFALKFVRGDYATLHPSRGRFRDFLTVVLRNLVIDHVRKKHALREKPATDQIGKFAGDTSEDHDQVFIEQWRRTLLERTWEVFRSVGSQRGALYYTALLKQAQDQPSSSAALAEYLSQQTGKKVTAASARQVLCRARKMFADCLRDEVRHSLVQPQASEEDVAEELRLLRLTKYLAESKSANERTA